MIAKNGIEMITLRDVEKEEINIDDLLVQEPSDRSAYLVHLYLVQRFYWIYINQWDKETTMKVKEGFLQQAHLMAFQQMPKLVELLKKAELQSIIEAEQMKWFLESGWQTLGEMMADQVSGAEPMSSERYDYKFIAEELLPRAPAIGITPGELLAASTQVGKLRMIVPPTRILLEGLEKGYYDEESVNNGVREFVQLAADTQVTKAALQKEVDKFSGRVRGNEIMAGWIYVLPNETLMVVSVPGEEGTHPIEKALSKMVEFDLGDYADLLSSLPGFTKKVGQLMFAYLMVRLQDGKLFLSKTSVVPEGYVRISDPSIMIGESIHPIFSQNLDWIKEE